jgi:hypothetical protein
VRFYGSIRIPFFKAFSPRIGFISRNYGSHRYNPRAIDGTTLMHGGSAAPTLGSWVRTFACVAFLLYVCVHYFLFS